MISADATDCERYSRLELIPWWDQELLAKARVMVVGAGALGNEIVKNLTLLGIGRVFLVDMDQVEISNLSRSPLFRLQDDGLPKAEVAARAAMEMNPHLRVRPFVGSVCTDVGLGVFRNVDLVMCGLDNREARLWVNRCCRRLGKPYIDGAIEGLSGLVRVFDPHDGPCYECTMTEADFAAIRKRKSCALLTRDQQLEGKTPTTPTVASVIAAVQCQEAVKLIHNRPELPAMSGSGFYFSGETCASFPIAYSAKEECMSHETWERVVETDWTSHGTTLREVLEHAKAEIGPDAVLELNRELVVDMKCGQCGVTTPCFALLDKLTESIARCPDCEQVRATSLCHSITGKEHFLDRPLAEVGVPAFDIIGAWSDPKEIYYELTGDKTSVLGIEWEEAESGYSH